MIDKIKKACLEKLKKIVSAGVDAYPAKANRTHTIGEAIFGFDKFSAEKKEIILAGRIRSWRAHGGSTFADIEDETGGIQIYFKKDVLGGNRYKFLENFDVGDFIECSGTLFATQKSEKTLLVSDYKILAKSLLPLPDKWYGLEDKEIRFRKRYLDLIMNKEVRERFVRRNEIIKEFRKFLDKEGFLEVETPILQPLAGGAAAKPFKTHLNALDIDLYLRIAPEMYLKRLIVGGFEKIYEIGRCFRNEGMDRQHNPDFTMLEFYWAYKDYNDLIEFTQNLLSQIVKKIKGGLVFAYQGKKIDFSLPWKRVKFIDAIKDASGIDILETKNINELRKKIEKLGIKIKESPNYGKLVDELYKETVRKNTSSPIVFTDYPVELGPLAKSNAGDKRIVERFQVVVNGFELVNAYSELNDPIEQHRRLREQVAKHKAGDKESPKEVDEDYIEALEYGMPPVAGEGIGIDRFAALLTDAPSLREIILFPTMRPERSASNSKSQVPNSKQIQNSKNENFQTINIGKELGL